MQVTICLSNPPTSIRGCLRNAFVEPQPCLFVGAISGKQIVKLVEKLEEAHCVGTIVVHKKGIPGGVRIKNVGANRLRVVVDFDGVQLVKRI